MYDFDDTIPPPARNPRQSYPFKDMRQGDSVFLYTEDYDTANAVRGAHTYGRNRGWKFMTKKEALGVRIWRVE